jgi:hypothetical protein
MYTRVFCGLCALAAVDAYFSAAQAAADSDLSFQIYGFAQTDLNYDTNRMDPAWDDAFRSSKIPTVEGTFGSDGQTSFSVKQSRFGVQGNVDTGENIGPLNFRFEFDLFGTGVDAGQTTFRLRHIYGQWGPILAGQTNTVFMDGDTFPNTIEYWGPTGMVFYRNVQIRGTWRTGPHTFAVALERPGNDVDAGNIRQLDPALGSNIRNDEELPDLTAHWRMTGSWGHVQLAGILRQVGFDTIGTPGNEPEGHETGWGINASGHLNFFMRDKILGSVVYGEGIASYMNDGGMDLAPEQRSATALGPKAVPLLGIMIYLDHYWSDRWSSSIGYSFTQVDNTNFQAPDAYHKGDYASVNLLYTPSSRILIGGELIWGQRTDNDGATGDDFRIQFSVKYSFDTMISL